MTIWARFRWQLRMAIAEKALDIWWHIAGGHVPLPTLEAYGAFIDALPSEPEGYIRTREAR